MNLSRAALAASLLTVTVWTAKTVVIALAGGLDKSPFEGPLFLLGLLACAAACVLVGAAAFAHRGTGWRVLGAVLAVLGVSVVGNLAQVAISAVEPAHPGWAYSEVNLWVIMLVLLAAAASLGARERRFAERSLTSAREDTRDRDRGPRARAGSRALP